MPTEYCCDAMQFHAESHCDEHPDRRDCPDAIVSGTPDRGFGIPIHDGGTSFVAISYCPWCGAPLRAA